MRRSVVETVLGAVVLFAAAFFLAFSYKSANVKPVRGYELVADFSGIGGLAVGDDVQISGVKVGNVTSVDLNDDTYLARVRFMINPTIKLSDDSSALISSESLMGGRYLSIEPGASDDILKPGEKIQFTQAPQNLEQLLGKFIFSQSGKKDEDKKDSSGASDTPVSVQESMPDASAPATP